MSDKPTSGSNVKGGNRVGSLRIFIGLGLLLLTGVFGYVAYYVVYYFEERLSNEEFNALAVQMERSTLSSMERKALALSSISNLLAMQCPDSEMWPNCSVPITSFLNITDPLIAMGELRTLAFAPIIEPYQVSEFEAFAYKTFEEEGYENMGLSAFGRGISAVDPNSLERFHDTEGPHLNNKYQLLTPVIQVGNLEDNRAAVMFNLYSQEARISAIDFMMDCFNAGGRGEDCISITDVIHLVQDPVFRPAVLVIHPVTAFNDPDKLVGLDYGVVNWDTVFSSVLPDFVDGIGVVLRGGEEDYTFEIKHGITRFKSRSDTHDDSYDSTEHHFAIPYFTGPIKYTVSIYKTDAFVDAYHSNLPIYACIMILVLMLVISGFLVTYDRSIQKAVKERDLVMDTKRLFVRFISHEMRTPMNIVHLGLKLISQELVDFMSSNTHQDTIKADALFPIMEEWVKLIGDIEASTDTSILVLNDLIDYDKIHLGGMTIVPEPLPVWKVVKDTVQPFFVQARQAGVELKMDIQIDKATALSSMSGEERQCLSELCVMADPIKISQVLRNLLSNALKFSCPNSTVEISAHFEKGKCCKKDLNAEGCCPFIKTGNIVFSVKDRGAGISPKDQKNLFQEGIQFRANQLQAGGGSGLGLWITKGIVELHNGTISAFSEGEGFGTTFTVTLPVGLVRPVNNADGDDYDVEKASGVSISEQIISSLNSIRRVQNHSVVPLSSPPPACAAEDGGGRCSPAVKQEEASTATAAATDIRGAVEAEAAGGVRLGSDQAKPSAKRKICNILAVDDSALSLKLVLRTLRRHGYTCYEAVDGLDCLKKYDSLLAEGVAIDVILMDYEMPVMNGKLSEAKPS
jgi:signal transduction histidine kinase